MNLTLKSLLIIALAFIALIVFIRLISGSILLRSFQELEEQQIRRDVSRALSAFEDDLNNIDTFLRDWSSWDDTCEFVGDPQDRRGYAASNLVGQSFTNPRHNFMLFFSPAGELLRGMAFDLDREVEVPVPGSLLKMLAPASLLHRRPGRDEPVKGVLVLPEGAVMLAARPILTSAENGPSRGTLAIGRYVDEKETAKLAATTHLELEILPPDDRTLPEECRSALLGRSEPEGIHIDLAGEDRARGSALVRDLSGRPALVFRITQDRGIYRQGVKTMSYYTRWLIALGLAALAFTALILQGFVLHPLRRLTRSVARIGQTSDSVGRVPVSSRDELGILASSINAMLASLGDAQKAIRESEARYRGVVEDQTELICRYRPDFALTFVNEAYCAYFGLKKEEILGRSFLPTIVEGDRPRVVSVIEALSAAHPVSSHEERVSLPAGEIRWLRWTNRLILGAAGRPLEYQAVGTDVTERKKLEEEILRAQKMESVGTLAGGIAHDFNNILVAVMGNLSLAAGLLPRDGRAGELIAQAETAARSARALARQLLTFARGGAPIRKTVILSRNIADAARLALSGSHCTAELMLPPDLWPVDADEGQITQAVNNLVINASQAMARGGVVTIRAENAVLPAGRVAGFVAGNYVVISVRDRGIGIPEEHLSRIFDPYFTTKQEGSGLGLAIVYSIAVGHGGAVDVESKPGKGSLFRVYLPARPGAPAAETPSAPAPRGSGRILLMDDDESVSAVTAQMLVHLGYRVETARDGEAMLKAYARARSENEPFAAVILDLTIHGRLGGKEAIARLLRLDPQAKAIVASGYSSDPVMAEFSKHGFAGVIAKPYDLAELGQALQAVLAK